MAYRARKEHTARQEDRELNNKNFAVGLFVALAFTAFFSATIWLTGKQGSEPTTDYAMFFDTDVGGLMLGGPVFYLGVEVGTVTAMTIIPGNPMQVRVNARVLDSTPIDRGTYASLAFQGITGIAVIKLNADPGVHEALQIQAGHASHVIAVRDTGFSALLAKAPNVVDKLDSVLVQVNQILGPENREFISSMLSDLSKVSSALASQEEAISQIPQTLQLTIEELSTTLIEIRSMVEKLEPGLSTTLANLDHATGNLADMTERLDSWPADNDTEMNGFMEDGLGQVPAVVSDSRAMI